MYDMPTYFGIKDTCVYLGLGRNTVLKLCQEHTHGFPAVLVGNRYQIDKDMLEAWRTDWFSGKFAIS